MSHQILFLMSDISSFSEGCVSPSSVAGVGSSAVQEAAMYRRLLLTAVLGLTLSACVPYYDGGSSYYRSEVYTAPAPVYYYGGGPSYQYRRGYYAPPPRYYGPPAVVYVQPGRGYYRDHDRRDYYDRGHGHGHGWGHRR